MPTEAPPVDPLLIVGGLACLLLVDLLACTLHRAPLAGLPLLAIFTVPVGMVGDAVSWWVFARHGGRLPRAALPPGERPGLALGAPARARPGDR